MRRTTFLPGVRVFVNMRHMHGYIYIFEHKEMERENNIASSLFLSALRNRNCVAPVNHPLDFYSRSLSDNARKKRRKKGMERNDCADSLALRSSEFRPPLRVIQICCSNAALDWLTSKRRRCRRDRSSRESSASRSRRRFERSLVCLVLRNNANDCFYLVPAVDVHV